MRFRLLTTSAALIGTCLAWLVPFADILVYGTHTVQEPNSFILFGELILFLLLITLGTSNLLILVRRKKIRLPEV